MIVHTDCALIMFAEEPSN